MTKVAILPIPMEEGGVSYHAVAGDMQSHGRTAGEALDALTAQLSDEESSMVVFVQNRCPDRFFSQDRQERLSELMHRWRLARDSGESLPPELQSELKALVEAESIAATKRAAALANDLSQ